MCPSVLYCWPVLILALQSVSHGKIDDDHQQTTFVPGKVISSKVPDSLKVSLYHKPQDAADKTPSPLKDSPKDQKVFRITYHTDSRLQHPPDLKHHYHQSPREHEHMSQDVTSSAVDNEQIATKGYKMKEIYDEFVPRHKKSQELREGAHLQKITAHISCKLKTGKIYPFGRRPGGLSADRQTDKNLLPCGPHKMCVCLGVKADCTGLSLNEFPKTLPREQQIIDVSYNCLTNLSLKSLLFYYDLHEVYLSFNLIKKLKKFSVNVNHPLRILSLAGNKLKNLDHVQLGALQNLKELYLFQNDITVITNKLLSGLKNLHTLDLSSNKLTNIAANAFDSLLKLRTLRLNNNVDLGYTNKTLPVGLFKPLRALRHLWIQGNADKTKDMVYPNEALGHLSNLMELNIDGLAGEAEFGHQIENLTRLHSLVFGFQGNCFIQNLSSSFFQHLPFLLKLTFVGCPFNYIEDGAFAKLDKLVNYTLAFPVSDYSLLDAMGDLQGLPNKNLRYLALVGFMKGKIKCRNLSGEDMTFINRFPLHRLYLDFNYISYVEDKFLEDMPRTLQGFYLRGNKFTFIDYRWNLLVNFTNIYEIDVREQNMYPTAPPESNWFEDEISYNSKPYIDQVREMSSEDFKCGDMIDVNFLDRQQSVCHKLNYQCCGTKSGNVTESQKTILYPDDGQCNPYDWHKACIPPNLKVLRASGFTEFGRALLYHNRSENTLCYLDFSRGFFTDWGNGNLPQQVKIADFSDNFCDDISPDFFPSNNQLRLLCINNNYLGPAFSEDVNGTIFSKLQGLRYLNIAMNNIFKIPTAFFKGLKNLKALDMHENKLQILDVDFSLMPNLRAVDLSENSITWITRRARRSLDTLAINHSITINLMYNPLPCTCEGVEVLQWLANTRVLLRYKEYLTCNSETEEKVLLGRIKRRIRSLKRKCIPNSELIIISSFSCFIFMLVVLCGLLYKHRWKIIYARNIWLVNMYGFRPKGRGTSQRMYDAYVVYSEEDRDFALNTMIEELEVRRGHKLCVEDRDFIPGNFNFNNITCAIQNSTITLLLLSPDFLSTRELEYATQMALMEQHNGQEKREVILLFRYTEIEAEKLTKELLTLMKQGRFLDYPRDQDESIKQRFWDRVSTEIGHTQNTDTPDFLSSTE